MALRPRDCVPKDWTALLSKATGPLGLGLDLATTEKDTSNPSSLTVTEKVGPIYIERLVLRFKTSREEVTRAIVAVVFEDIARLKVRPRRLCIDATNERFFAQRLQQQFSIYCPVQLVVSSENVPHITIDGEPVDWKSYTGNLYVNAYTDGLMRIPNAAWLKDDRRLVKKDKGRFVASTSPDGGHGDTFDSGKLARLALEGGGPAEISSTPVGSFGQSRNPLPGGLRNPLLKLAQQQRSRRTLT